MFIFTLLLQFYVVFLYLYFIREAVEIDKSVMVDFKLLNLCIFLFFIARSAKRRLCY